MKSNFTQIAAIASLLLTTGWRAGAETVTVTAEQHLSDLITTEQAATIEELVIITDEAAGEAAMLTDADINYINASFTNIKTVDMRNADIYRGKFATFNNNQSIEIFYFPRNTVSLGGFTNTSAREIYFPGTINAAMANRMGQNRKCEKVEFYSENPQVKSIDGVLYWADMGGLIYYPSGKTDEEYVIAEGVTSINTGAMQCNEHLRAITFPSTFNKINNSGREFGCSQNVNEKNPKLSALYVADGNETFGSMQGMLYNIVEKAIVVCPPAWAEETLDIDGSKVSKLSGTLFADNKSIKWARFGEGFTELDGNVFKAASNLEFVEMPVTMAKISGETFNNCGNLKRVKCWAVTPPEFGEIDRGERGIFVGNATFNGLPADAVFGVPDEAIETYKNSCWNREFVPEGKQNNVLGFRPEQFVSISDGTITGVDNVTAPEAPATFRGQNMEIAVAGEWDVYGINGVLIARGNAEAGSSVDLSTLSSGYYIFTIGGEAIRITK